MDITKVKYDGAKVRIEYQQQRPDKQFDEFSLQSLDRPTAGFIGAMEALAVDVVDICEMPADDVKKVKVRGVTVTRTNDVMGLCITALKSLKTANSPLVLNTPHLTEEPYSEGGECPLLKRETLDHLHTLLLEAEAYVKGEREQPSLLPDASEQPAETSA